MSSPQYYNTGLHDNSKEVLLNQIMELKEQLLHKDQTNNILAGNSTISNLI